MWDKPSLAVKKVPYFNSLLDQFGGEGWDSKSGYQRTAGFSVASMIVVLLRQIDGLMLSSYDNWSEWQDLNLRPPRPERGAPDLGRVSICINMVYPNRAQAPNLQRKGGVSAKRCRREGNKKQCH